PRVRVSIEDIEGMKVALVDLKDLWDKMTQEKGPLALEMRLGNRSYFYLETTGFFKPGELPNLFGLVEQLGWRYREFPGE
ncbi:MAG: hypothetical protein NZ992_01750, partial [Candidatus Korarchaeum sp.]|nr:hypothetical protein [Candidatus Korarchaeum sp.]